MPKFTMLNTETDEIYDPGGRGMYDKNMLQQFGIIKADGNDGAGGGDRGPPGPETLCIANCTLDMTMMGPGMGSGEDTGLGPEHDLGPGPDSDMKTRSMGQQFTQMIYDMTGEQMSQIVPGRNFYGPGDMMNPEDYNNTLSLGGSGSTWNATDAKDWNVAKCFGLGSLTILDLFAVIFNVLLAIALIKNRQTLSYPFYKIVWQVVFCNLLYQLIQWVNVLPALFLGSMGVLPAPFDCIMPSLETFSEYGTLIFILIMAVNRFVVFASKDLAQKLFGSKSTYVAIAIGWLGTILPVTTVTVLGCRREYVDMYGIFVDVCDNAQQEIAVLLYQIITYVFYSVPLLTLICYLLLFVILRRQRKDLVSNKRKEKEGRRGCCNEAVEVRLLRQSAMIYLSYFCCSVLSIAQTYIMVDSSTAFLMYLLQRGISSVNCFTFPVFFFTTSNEVRNSVLNLIAPCHKKYRTLRSSSAVSIITTNSRASSANSNTLKTSRIKITLF